MHEMSLAEGIVDAVERTARQHAIGRVERVRIAVGELAGVDIPSLTFAWTSVIKGTILEGSALDIERPSGQAWCMDCSQNVPLAKFGDPCPRCGGFHLVPNQGTELKVIDFVPAEEA